MKHLEINSGFQVAIFETATSQYPLVKRVKEKNKDFRLLALTKPHWSSLNSR
ncbi:hypothetical protein GXM_03635 [Nostoc sphaeroides CCNUC1]|uniref:Uncharacterized protein n=1 Tax=Nostoc sphaeroides CCNUC1 TaxID=2653204 RepID=A0A5P8W0A8_9NOSO|nr:hypothetical protein GXM_03635 [Nostoc sphaeroides CCNUC1]